MSAPATEPTIFSTQDLALAALLRCRGFDVVRVERHATDRNAVVFMFENVPASIRAEFHGGTAIANVTTFHNAIRQLRRMALDYIQNAPHGGR